MFETTPIERAVKDGGKRGRVRALDSVVAKTAMSRKGAVGQPIRFEFPITQKQRFCKTHAESGCLNI